MLSKLRQAGLIWPTVAALAGLAVLIGLGTWQLERKRWKEDLLAKIAARAHANPVEFALKARVDQSTIVLEVDEGSELFKKFVRGHLEYTHVSVIGRFHHDKERYLYVPSPKGAGWHVYTPLEFASGRIVWINRGSVPNEHKGPATRLRGQVAGVVEVRGLVRLPAAKGLFTPENDAARNIWYWPDLAAMTAAAFPAGPQNAPGAPQRPAALPQVIEADAKPEPPGGLPRGGVTRLQLPNRHLEYAVTWYGLALTLVGVYLAFAFSRLRASSST